MSILVIGSAGSMGRRYQAILRHLNEPFLTFDLEWDSEGRFDSLAKKAEGFIVACPTSNHLEYLRDLCEYKKPVLCEKPVATHLDHLAIVLSNYRRAGVPIAMTHQYRWLADRDAQGPSFYNFYNHGKDGLAWDCLQVLALASGDVELREDSPVWQCQINGKRLDISNMDHAYVLEVEDWLRRPARDPDEILEAHIKVTRYIARHG